MELFSDFAFEVLIELAPFALLLLIGAVVLGVLWLKSRPSKAVVRASDYIVWEADPGAMEDIKADMADNGWHLVDTRSSDAQAVQCRFEKTGMDSRCLSDVFNFDRRMPRTQQIRGGIAPIKIKEHGSRRSGEIHRNY